MAEPRQVEPFSAAYVLTVSLAVVAAAFAMGAAVGRHLFDRVTGGKP